MSKLPKWFNHKQACKEIWKKYQSFWITPGTAGSIKIQNHTNTLKNKRTFFFLVITDEDYLFFNTKKEMKACAMLRDLKISQAPKLIEINAWGEII